MSPARAWGRQHEDAILVARSCRGCEDTHRQHYYRCGEQTDPTVESPPWAYRGERSCSMRTRTTLSSHTVLSSLTKLQGCWWRSNVWFTPRASLWLITNLDGASCGEETPVRSKHLPGALLFQATLPDTLHTAARGSQSRSNATPQSPPCSSPVSTGSITRAASRGDKAAIETIPHTLCKRTPSTLRHGQTQTSYRSQSLPG